MYIVRDDTRIKKIPSDVILLDSFLRIKTHFVSLRILKQCIVTILSFSPIDVLPFNILPPNFSISLSLTSTLDVEIDGTMTSSSEFNSALGPFSDGGKTSRVFVLGTF